MLNIIFDTSKFQNINVIIARLGQENFEPLQIYEFICYLYKKFFNLRKVFFLKTLYGWVKKKSREITQAMGPRVPGKARLAQVYGDFDKMSWLKNTENSGISYSFDLCMVKFSLELRIWLFPFAPVGPYFKCNISDFC